MLPDRTRLESTALVTSPAIGDSLLLMTVAHNLRRHGAAVTVFGPHIHALRAWFPGLDIQPAPAAADAPAQLSRFRTVIQLHDHRPLPDFTGLHPNAIVLEELCRRRSPQSMAQRLAEFSRSGLGLVQAGTYNGIVPPSGLTHRRHAERVVIHPTASTPDKCWLPGRFIALGLKLRRAGFDPQFIVSPAERPRWEHVRSHGLGLPDLGALDKVAAWVFESGWFIGNDSGIGHLASNLHVPTLSLFMRQGGARTWRPDWGPGLVLVGSTGIPTGKLKEKLWKYALTSGRVARAFAQLRAREAAQPSPPPWSAALPAASAAQP
ncbi:Glycosyltransferase family 9 (heptosyltransferase) [Pigmentiphaga humi]|uniref:Glycosyltransferase family 9 (Heptosyltransferase) n=1 Tax=Pigmentiphaga humi TaxID=2478468 RepID=A0A3P4B4F2_9BURK|nr:glycosyltransferase family 9 protein [Pigmentiphaga humi]VCU71163.1 Glycosyltransferase family 9 (heptosyltransferase) [Pigmentiphaga humi]